jgi:carboxypeptidase T
MKSFALLFAIIFSVSAKADLSTKRTYKDAVNFIHALAAKYPANAQLFVLGKSDRGLDIEGLKIGNGAIHNALVATHHGNEYGSTELALSFAESIAQNPIVGQTMYVIPVLNIDGYDNRSRYENVNGTSLDLNRDYPGPCGSEGPFFSKSTKAMADFIDKENIVVSSTLHTYWPAAVYPWGISTDDVNTPYTPTFLKMVMAATQFSQYQGGNSTEVIYPADGCYEDYAYWKHGIWSILFEVGESHNPSISDMQTMVKGNVPGLRAMYEMAPTERAPKHDFTGKCSLSMRLLDLHIE